MIKQFLSRKSSAGEATVVLSVAFLVSRLFGLLRDRTLAHYFGAGPVLDAYYAAFRIPDLIFNLLILGALSSAFIPVFTDYLNNKNRDDAWGLVNTLVNFGIIVLSVLLAVIVCFAPAFTHIVAPGLNQEGQVMVTNMMRVMALSPLFFGLSNLAGGILNSFKNFIVYAMAPIMYNLGIILGAMFLVPHFGYMGLAYGVIAGAFLHMAVQIPSVIMLGYRYRMHLDIKHPGLQKIGWLMIPRTLGLAVGQFSALINTIIASTLAVGSIAVFNLADNLQSLPISIFGISFAVAIFPTLSEKYSLSRMEEFRDDFVSTLRQIVFLIIPTMMMYWILRAQIVRLVLGSGQFGWEDTRFTVSVLAFFTFGMIGQALVPLLARSFYALQNTIIPLVAGLASLVINIVIAFIASQYLHVVGLALAVSVASIVNMIILFWLLVVRLPKIEWKKLWLMISQVVFASLIIGGVGYWMLRVVNLLVTTHTVVGLLTQTLVTMLVMVLSYLALMRVMKVTELDKVFNSLGRIFKKG